MATLPEQSSCTVWRAKIHSEREDLRDDVLRDQARVYCRRVGVVGIGWGAGL